MPSARVSAATMVKRGRPARESGGPVGNWTLCSSAPEKIISHGRLSADLRLLRDVEQPHQDRQSLEIEIPLDREAPVLVGLARVQLAPGDALEIGGRDPDRATGAVPRGTRPPHRPAGSTSHPRASPSFSTIRKAARSRPPPDARGSGAADGRPAASHNRRPRRALRPERRAAATSFGYASPPSSDSTRWRSSGRTWASERPRPAPTLLA